MENANRHQVEGAVSRHLRASGEPVREAFLYERVRGDGIDVTGEAFIGILLRMEVEGHLRVDPVRDDQHSDPEPFEPRYWRVTE